MSTMTAVTMPVKPSPAELAERNALRTFAATSVHLEQIGQRAAAEMAVDVLAEKAAALPPIRGGAPHRTRPDSRIGRGPSRDQHHRTRCPSDKGRPEVEPDHGDDLIGSAWGGYADVVLD